jgi:hypothetical protein
MLVFEVSLLITTALFLLFNQKVHAKLDQKTIIGLLATLLILHFIIDGYRWQMIPSYLMWLFAMIAAIWPTEKASSKFIKTSKILGIALLFGLAYALPSIFPIFELPKTTGPYAVGTTDILLETDRDEVITPDVSDTRRLMIKAWYPTNASEGEHDPYIDKGGRNGFAQKYGLHPSMLHYLDKIETHIYKDAELANDQFPVLIFSHGYHSKANGYYALLSEVASQGYVIFSVNHTFESTGTTFPDGSEVYFNNEYARKIEENTWETINPVVDAFREGLDYEERHPIVQKALVSYFAKDIIKRWADDIVNVVDEIDRWNQSGLFKDRLDATNVGVFGHSRGGGAAGESLLIDSRIQAGANLDGIQWGQIVNTQFQKPFLFLSSDWPEDHEDLSQHAYANKSTAIFYEGILLQSGHSNFMDIPYMIPLQALNLAGDINPDLAFEITNKLVISFFDKYVKHKSVNLERIDSEYQQLEMEISVGDSLR